MSHSVKHIGIALLLFIFLSAKETTSAHGLGPHATASGVQMPSSRLEVQKMDGDRTHYSSSSTPSPHQMGGSWLQAHTIHLAGTGFIVIFFLGALIRQYIKNVPESS